MRFLEASAILKTKAATSKRSYLVAASGSLESLDIFLRATARLNGEDATNHFLPFNTLQQFLRDPQAPAEIVCILLTPWDLVPQLDWRSGTPMESPSIETVVDEARQIVLRATALAHRVVYLNAPVPPISLDVTSQNEIVSSLLLLVRSFGLCTIDDRAFSLKNYLASGNPLDAAAFADVASLLINGKPSSQRPSAKVLVTDLDHTLWYGVIGDDGESGIAHQPEGRGYVHYLYQTLLRRLKHDGVILAAVSKNELDVALRPLQSGAMALTNQDFVQLVASWEPKSLQIEQLSDSLNIGLDDFVFVDDNLLELEEVRQRLPNVRCLEFPQNIADFPAFMNTVAQCFERSIVTDEDRHRSELYRRRVAAGIPRVGKAADISGLLHELSMKVGIEDRTEGDYRRAIQLINKTNQFNLNGLRLDDARVASLIAEGARVFTATLQDKSGDHGQILASIVGSDGTVYALVMSCRVFQRRIEHAFVGWLTRRFPNGLTLQFQSTEKNVPLRKFFAEVLQLSDIPDGPLCIDRTVGMAMERYADSVHQIVLDGMQVEQS